MSRKDSEPIQTTPTTLPPIPTDPALLSAFLQEHRSQLGAHTCCMCTALLAIANAITEASWAISEETAYELVAAVRRLTEDTAPVVPSWLRKGGAE